MRLTVTILALLAVLLLASVPAYADPISLNATTLHIADPDTIWTDAASSPYVNNAFDGVTLSTFNSDVNAGNGVILALGGGVPQIPGWYPAVFGHSIINFPGGGCSGCWSFGFAELRADFEGSVQLVSVDFIDRFSGIAMVQAYNKFDQLIGSSIFELVGHPAEEARRISVQFNDASSSIAYILAGANEGVYGVIDRLSWETVFVSDAVPEPSTLTLLGLGLVGLIGYGRSHRKR